MITPDFTIASLFVVLFLILAFLLALVFILIKFSNPLENTLKALTAILVAHVGGRALPTIETGQPSLLKINFEGIGYYGEVKVIFGENGGTWPLEFISVTLLIGVILVLMSLKK